MVDALRRTSVYLVEAAETDEAEKGAVRRHCVDIFEEELDAWYSDRAVWPQRRDLKTFREWFDVETQALVGDLANEPIAVEEW